jgi:hypothetical protein
VSNVIGGVIGAEIVGKVGREPTGAESPPEREPRRPACRIRDLSEDFR